jgi:lipoprotein-anchoring transpeptidase ErfK/SrfK
MPMSSVPASSHVVGRPALDRPALDGRWQPSITVAPRPPAPAARRALVWLGVAAPATAESTVLPSPLPAAARLAGRWRPAVTPAGAIAVAATAGVLGVGGWAGVEAADMAARFEGRILPGVVVDGVDLSGMTTTQAVAALEVRAARHLDRQVRIEAAGVVQVVTPRDLGATADVDEVVRRLAADRRSTPPWRWLALRFVGPTPRTVAAVTISAVPDRSVRTAARQLATVVDRRPADAEWVYDDTAIAFTPHADGRRLDVDATVGALAAALADPHGEPVRVQAPVAITPAATTLADVGQVVFLDQSRHHLQLFDDGVLIGEWDVATGTAGFPTPTGEFAVGEKRENPTWGNPAPDGWGADLPAWIGPGPGNPLGVRAINWDGAPNIRFHGTDQEWSIGTDASHGCVRMRNADVVELFDLVEVGARIVSVA